MGVFSKFYKQTTPNLIFSRGEKNSFNFSPKTLSSHSGSVLLPSGEGTPEYFGKVISNLDFKYSALREQRNSQLQLRTSLRLNSLSESYKYDIKHRYPIKVHKRFRGWFQRVKEVVLAWKRSQSSWVVLRSDTLNKRSRNKCPHLKHVCVCTVTSETAEYKAEDDKWA